MKNALFFFCLTVSLTLLGQDQTNIQPIAASPRPVAAAPSIGGHFEMINGVVTNTATPLAKLNAPTLQKRIQPTSTGASADFGLHKVSFASNANEPGVITLTLPGGVRLRSQALFLAYYDPNSGQSYLLGQAQDAQGSIVSANEVIYSNAFSNIRADLRYRYTANSLEQDLILLAKLPPPESVGFNGKTVRLALWSEFFDPISPASSSQTINLRASNSTDSPSLANDQTLDFGGTMRIVTGKSFGLDDSENEPAKLSVAKTWTTISGRSFLVEMIDYAAAKPRLDLLPAVAHRQQAKGRQLPKDELIRVVDRRPPSPAGQGPMRLAGVHSGSTQGFVLDYIIVTACPLPPNIISWWPAGGNAQDAISNNNGTLNGGATFDFGKVGQSFSFGGVADNVVVADAPSLNPTNAISLEAWVYIAGLQGQDRDLISKDGQISGRQISGRQYTLMASSLNKFRAYIGTGSGTYYLDGTTSLQTNTWYHVAETYDSGTSNLCLYVNGILETNGMVSGTIITSTQPVRIGGGAPTGVSPQYYFQGRVDEASLYSRALSSNEVAAIFSAGAAGKQNPNCVTVSTNAIGWWPGDGYTNDIAWTNNGTFTTLPAYDSGMMGQAFSFDGVSNFVSVADVPHLNPPYALTVEAWVYCTGNDFNHRDIISKDGETYDRQFILTMSDIDAFRAHVGLNSYGLTYFDGATTVNLFTWYHVAMTYDGNDLILYVNGIEDGRVTAPDTIISTTQPVRIGGGAPPGTLQCFFQGLIDEATMYDRALSAAEISAIYLAGSAGKCKVDSDGDGLTNLQEYHLGTDPNKADTDGDGISDYNEIFVNHTDPLNPDSDYDGRSDGQELLDGTDPLNANSVTNTLLAYWQFPTNTWVGQQGQLPMVATNLQLVSSWSNNAVLVDSTNVANLKYQAVETNGSANINCRIGSVKFWFKPDWNSSSTNGGIGPQSEARLIELGTKNTADGWWALLVSTNGNLISFVTQTNGLGVTNLAAAIAWRSNEWHQVAVTYCPTNTSLYLDGLPVVTNGVSLAYYPNFSVRSATGINLGSDKDGNNQARGRFDELMTFNYALSATEILNDYGSKDIDGDGIINFQDADPNNPDVGILHIFIENPRDGSTIQ
jgi:hypothetical protein